LTGDVNDGVDEDDTEKNPEEEDDDDDIVEWTLPLLLKRLRFADG